MRRIGIEHPTAMGAVAPAARPHRIDKGRAVIAAPDEASRPKPKETTMTTNNPLVIDGANGTDRKAVWVERSRFFCRAGTGRIECQVVQPGIFKTVPGTYEDKPAAKSLPDWKRRALARMQS